MIFDVMVRAGYSESGKQIINVYRVHDSRLSEYLRDIQDSGHYIFSVIPLFKSRSKEEKTVVYTNNIDSLPDVDGF